LRGVAACFTLRCDDRADGNAIHEFDSAMHAGRTTTTTNRSIQKQSRYKPFGAA